MDDPTERTRLRIDLLHPREPWRPGFRAMRYYPLLILIGTPLVIASILVFQRLPAAVQTGIDVGWRWTIALWYGWLAARYWPMLDQRWRLLLSASALALAVLAFIRTVQG